MENMPQNTDEAIETGEALAGALDKRIEAYRAAHPEADMFVSHYDQMPFDPGAVYGVLFNAIQHIKRFTTATALFEVWAEAYTLFNSQYAELSKTEAIESKGRNIHLWADETRDLYFAWNGTNFQIYAYYSLFKLLTYSTHVLKNIPDESYKEPRGSSWAIEIVSAMDAAELSERESALQELFDFYASSGWDIPDDPEEEEKEWELPAAIETYFRQMEAIGEHYKDRYNTQVIDIGPDPTIRKVWGLGTSQENQEMLLALSHAPSRRGYTDAKDGGFMHRLEGSAYFSKWSISEDIDSLNALTVLNRDMATRLRDLMDADCMLAFNYIQGLFVESEPLPLNMRRSIWIDLDDIWKAIGWDPRSTQDRLECRQRIYSVLLYVHHAEVHGQRSIPYYDTAAERQISTVISSSPWQIGSKQWPLVEPQMIDLFQSEPPVRVELTQSREWTDLCEGPYTKQVIEGCEVIGQIPGNQAGGAWARVIAVRALQQWKIDPRHEIQPPTRREFIDTYPAKKAPLAKLLEGTDPLRIIKYWREALHILVENGVIATTEELNAQRPEGNKWAGKWLDTHVRILPGERFEGYVKTKATNKPTAPVRRLPGPKNGRRKRSRGEAR